MKVFTAVMSLLVVSLVPPSLAPSAQDTHGSQMYLPDGSPVPPGAEISQPPRPFTGRAHARPMRNGIPHANVVGRRGIRLPKRVQPVTGGRAQTPAFEPGSGDRGLWLTAGAGIYAANDASLTLSIPDSAIGTTIYAPTHMSPGNSCIETVTAHWRYEGMDATAHGHGFWDWCATDGQGAWQVFEFMDSAWTDRYVRRLHGKMRYWTQVYSDTPASWSGLLYNFTEGRWEEKTAISGLTVNAWGTTGWTMWESHHLMDVAQVCPKFPDIQASGLRVFLNGAWARLSPDNSADSLGPYGQCWVDETYTFGLFNRWDRWLARTSK